METGTHLAALFVFVASGYSAYLWCNRLPPCGRALRILTGLVIWELLQLLPVHILAAFQILGLLGRVTVFAVAAAQAVALAISIACALGHRPSAVPYPAQNLQIWPRYMLWTTLL